MSRSLLALLSLVALVSVSATGSAIGPIKPPPPPPPPVYQDPTGPAAPTGFVVDRDYHATPGGPGPGSARATWFNPGSSSSAVLQRSPTGLAPWTSAAVRSTAIAAGSTTSLTDIHTPVDALSCYRVVLSNGSGSTASPVKCVFTRDGFQRPLFRARIRLKTATLPGSSSDAHVRVRLQGPVAEGVAQPYGNGTWLDTPGDDFAGGSDRFYELSTSNLSDISDVTQIAIDLVGSDDLCLEEVELELDNERAFLHTAATCDHVTQAASLFFVHDTLRASLDWQEMSTDQQQATFFEFPWLDAIVTSAIGNELHDHDTYQFQSENPTVHTIDAHRRRYEYGLWKLGTFPITAQFDLVTGITCVDGQAQGVVSVESPDADADGWLYMFWPLSEALVELLEPTWKHFETSTDIGVTCDFAAATGLDLCFDSTGLGPSLGGCD